MERSSVFFSSSERMCDRAASQAKLAMSNDRQTGKGMEPEATPDGFQKMKELTKVLLSLLYLINVVILSSDTVGEKTQRLREGGTGWEKKKKWDGRETFQLK